jgi:hypothetical protein
LYDQVKRSLVHRNSLVVGDLVEAVIVRQEGIGRVNAIVTVSCAVDEIGINRGCLRQKPEWCLLSLAAKRK